MPNCFTLTRRSAPEAGPVKFTVIDEEMCRHFAVPCDPVEWYLGWYDVVGWALAMGADFAKIRAREVERQKTSAAWEEESNARFLQVIDWLAEHFTSDAWAEVGRR